jgi:hypothetical protein
LPGTNFGFKPEKKIGEIQAERTLFSKLKGLITLVIPSRTGSNENLETFTEIMDNTDNSS